MKYIYLVATLLLATFPLLSQDLFVLPAEFATSSILTDSTFEARIYSYPDQTGNGWTAVNILPGQFILDGVNRKYEILSKSIFNNSFADVVVKELQDEDVGPSGSGQVYVTFPSLGTYPVSPLNGIGINPVTQYRAIYDNLESIYNFTLTAVTSPVDSIQWDTTSTVVPSKGVMAWNSEDQTIDIGIDGVTLQVGQEMYILVKNQSGSEIADGAVVRYTGALGASGRMTGDLMVADNTYPVMYTLGIATEAIPNGEDGFITVFGAVRGVNTSSYSDGDILYVSETTPGGLTNVAPTGTNQVIPIAVVLKSGVNGVIFVRPTLLPSIEELQGVDITTPADGSVLIYNNTSGLWEDGILSVTDADSDPTNELQTLSWSAGTGGNDEITLSDGGGTVTITDDVNDADASTTNELQTISLVTNDLTLSDGGGTVDLSGYLDNTNLTQEEVQDFVGPMVTGNTEERITVTYDDINNNFDFTVEAALSNYTNDIGFLTAEVDGSISNELQTISLATNTLSLSDGGGSVDLSPYLDNTDDQTLSLVTNTLSIEDGNSVDLSGYVNTDNQTLSLVTNTLSISGGNSVDLSGYLDNTNLSQEQVEDFAGGMFTTNSETLITSTYNDPTGKVDLTVNDDLSLYDNTTSAFLTTEVDGSVSNELQTLSWSAGTGGNDEITLSDGGGTVTITDNDTQLTQEQVEDIAGAMLTGVQTLITVTYDGVTNDFDFVVNDDLSLYDNTTSGFLTTEVDGSTSNELQTLSWAAGTGGNDEITLSDGGGTVTITDENTQLSQEQVEDFAGGMWTGNTETGITVTYQDADGTMDIVNDNLNSVASATSGSTTLSVDLSSSLNRIVQIDMTSASTASNVTFTISNPTTAGIYTFHFQNTSGSGHNVDFPTNFLKADGTTWDGGSTVTYDADEWVACYYDGTNYYCK